MTLKELRLSKGLSQQQLAEEFGVSLSYINHLESGRRNFTDEIKGKMIKFLHVRANEMERVIEKTVKYEPKMYNNWISKLKIYDRPVLEDFIHYVKREDVQIKDLEEFTAALINYLQNNLIRSISNELKSEKELANFIYDEYLRKMK
ncbi:MAG: helix-turn-helix transcriptional regulator [Syntrophothermus sp.]